MLDIIHNWIISKVVGSKMVIMNAEIGVVEGELIHVAQSKGLVKNNHFLQPARFGVK